MNFAVSYMVYRFLYRIADFFHHWYQDASRVFWTWVLDRLKALSKSSGMPPRSMRTVALFPVYAVFLVVSVIGYVLWILLPPALLLYALFHFLNP